MSCSLVSFAFFAEAFATFAVKAFVSDGRRDQSLNRKGRKGFRKERKELLKEHYQSFALVAATSGS